MLSFYLVHIFCYYLCFLLLLAFIDIIYPLFSGKRYTLIQLTHCNVFFKAKSRKKYKENLPTISWVASVDGWMDGPLWPWYFFHICIPLYIQMKAFRGALGRPCRVQEGLPPQNTYTVYHSVCPLVGIRTPHSLSRKRLCGTKGGAHSPAGEGKGVPILTTGEKACLLCGCHQR